MLLWLKINPELKSVINLVDKDSICKSDTVFSFSYKSLVAGFEERLPIFNAASRSVFHLSHYFINTSLKANNLRYIDNAYLAGDSDISNNRYFRYFFDWYDKEFIVLPFSVGERFISAKSTKDRHYQLGASGTFHDLKNEPKPHLYCDFRSVTGSNNYHQLREELYVHKDELPINWSVNTGPYRSSGARGPLSKLFSFLSTRQKTYFSLDIVDFYCSCSYVVVGEEKSGFPAIGSLEAMACGAALVGDPNCYDGLGLIQGVHYVSHDGSLESLYQVVNKYSESDLVGLSATGRKFVVENFSAQSVYARWLEALS